MLRTFISPTQGINHFLGWSAAAIGDNVLLGAPGDGPGTAYLFDGTTGELLHKYLNPSPADTASFGYSVAGVGTNVLVGTPAHHAGGVANSGAAFLFTGVPEPSSVSLLVLGLIARSACAQPTPSRTVVSGK